MTTTEHLVEFIETDPDAPYALGRSIINHDPMNYEYRALVQPPPRQDRPGKSHWTRDVYNQGNQPRCAAEAAVGICRTSPLRHTFTDWNLYDDPHERQQLYLEAQGHDPWPGSNYAGTSTDAPFKVLRNRGHVAAWKWLFGEAELREYVTWYGPAVVGTIWHHAMFTPDNDGYIAPGGGQAGGHAYRIVQYSTTRHAYRIVNSWGRGWGQSGRAWIIAPVLAQLLADNGEAATIG